MPKDRLAKFILFPELELYKSQRNGPVNIYTCLVRGRSGFCPGCGVESFSVYDHRWVKVKDAPLRDKFVYLKIKKRRFECKDCRKVFTEKIPGILKAKRSTERFERHLLWACETFQNLKQVTKALRCSSGAVYQTLYRQLDLKLRKNRYPWPKVIGLDEHSFQKRRTGNIPFASMFVDYKNRKIFEVVDSKSSERLKEKLAPIPGRENVEQVVIDLADPYKKFVREFFPRAKMTADKFHVLRLLHPAINRRRKEITGDRRSLRIRRLLLMNASRLDYFQKAEILDFLNDHPELKQIWITKEKMHALYRCKGIDRARLALHNLLKNLKNTTIKELKTLRRTLWRWAQEILNHFLTGLTNGRTEGFNTIAKLVKKRAFGYRNFENYRLKLLCSCL